ncbi:MAG: DUF2380 domain-containing protein [Fimbriimonadales bacterium]
MPGSGIISDSHATYTGVVSERRSGASRWMHQGVSGSNVLMTDASGNVTDTRTFDAFGKLLGSTGSNPDSFRAFAGFGSFWEAQYGGYSSGGEFFDPGLGLSQNDGGSVNGRPGPPSHRLQPMIAAVDGEGAAFLPDYPVPRTPAEEFKAGAWYGFETGLAALGSSLSLGFWDGGEYKDAPGFGEAKFCADVGTTIFPGMGALKGTKLLNSARVLDGVAATAVRSAAVYVAPRSSKAFLMEWHHLLPWGLRDKFKAAGLNVNEFLMELSAGMHRLKPWGIHTIDGGNWNKCWERFFDQNPNANKDQILDYLQVLIDHFGLS